MTEPHTLAPFSGDNPTCVKCGNVGAGTRYNAGQGLDHQYPAGQHVGVEHLHRECCRCGYGWPEAIAAAPGTALTTTGSLEVVTRLAQSWIADDADVTESLVRAIFADAGRHVLAALNEA